MLSAAGSSSSGREQDREVHRVRTFLRGLIGFGVATLIAATASAQRLSCDDGVVEMSDSKYLVESKCGEPTFTDATRVMRVFERDDEVLQEFVEVEDWLYDFGPNRLVVVLTFEKDRLIGMRSFGYGRLTAIERGPRGF